MIRSLLECRAKRLHPLAVQRDVRAIVGGGIYPGLSNVMAAHIISANKREYDEEGRYQESVSDAGTSAERALVKGKERCCRCPDCRTDSVLLLHSWKRRSWDGIDGDKFDGTGRTGDCLSGQQSCRRTAHEPAHNSRLRSWYASVCVRPCFLLDLRLRHRQKGRLFNKSPRDDLCP